MKRIAVVVAVLAGLVAGCGRGGADDERGEGDAGISAYDDTPVLIINEADKYANVSLKCVGGDLIVSHRRPGAAPQVVGNAASCAPGEAERIGIPRVGDKPLRKP